MDHLSGLGARREKRSGIGRDVLFAAERPEHAGNHQADEDDCPLRAPTGQEPSDGSQDAHQCRIPLESALI